MRSIVSLITAVAVGLHLILGCCAHHGHAGEGGRCSEHARESATSCAHEHAHGCSHGHDHSSPVSEGPAPVEPAEGDCHGSHCAFLLVGKTTFVPDVSAAAPSFSDVDPVASQVALAAAGLPRDWDDPFEPAVRAHLLHQVFLN